MIAWLNPAALAGLAALAVPVLIHLLRQHRASRVPFPSLRFVHPSRSAAIRLRRTADPWLLLIRLAVLGLAAVALAQPVVLTSSRLEAWNARTARAIVVDTSESMRLHGAESAAREAFEAESRTAFATARIETADLRAGVEQAAAWLSQAPPALREIVIVSDFQAGALTTADLARVPGTVGVRAVQAGTATTEHAFRGMTLLSSGPGNTETHIQVTGSTTRVTLTGRSQGRSTGLRIRTSREEEEAGRSLVRTVAAAGTPAPSGEQPIAVVFAGAEVPEPLTAIETDWMIGTIVRLMDDVDLREAAAEFSAPEGAAVAEPWTVVSRDAQHRPLVRAAAAGGELLVDVAGAAGSYLAAAALRGVLLARHRGPDYAEQEIVRASAGELATWSRVPAPVGREVALHANTTDARWFWALALLMLGLEALVRRSRTAAVQEAHADAA